MKYKCRQKLGRACMLAKGWQFQHRTWRW